MNSADHAQGALRDAQVPAPAPVPAPTHATLPTSAVPSPTPAPAPTRSMATPTPAPTSGGQPHEPTPVGREETPAGLPGPTVRMAMMAGLAAITVGLTLRPPAGNTSEPAETPVVASAQPAPSSALPSTSVVDGSSTPAALAATADEPVAPEAPEAPDNPADSSPPAQAAEESAQPPASSEAPQPPASEASAADDASATSTASDGAVYVDDFESESGQWTSMTGTWAVADGLMVQSDPTGFDYINQLGAELPEEYDLSVRLRGRDGVLGGGVIIGQPNAGSRRGAHIVDFTNGGNFLRWGQYAADSGIYTYIGGLNVGASPDDWHELAVEVRLDTTLVYLDGAYLGALDPVGPGTAGLITSESSVEFDDLRIDPVS